MKKISVKKEIERMQEQYKDILNGEEIYVQMEKSDPLDNMSARCYRIFVVFDACANDIICEYGFCAHKEKLIERFEKKLQERRDK